MTVEPTRNDLFIIAKQYAIEILQIAAQMQDVLYYCKHGHTIYSNLINLQITTQNANTKLSLDHPLSPTTTKKQNAQMHCGFNDEKLVFCYESECIERSYKILVLSNAAKSIN